MRRSWPDSTEREHRNSPAEGQSIGTVDSGAPFMQPHGRLAQSLRERRSAQKNPTGTQCGAKEQSTEDRKEHEDRSEIGFLSRPALPKEWAPRNTPKDAKWDDRCGLGGPCHIARPDLDAGRAPARSMSKKRATAIFDQFTGPSELVPHLFVSFVAFCVISSFLPSVRARFKSRAQKSSLNCAIFDVSTAKITKSHYP